MRRSFLILAWLACPSAWFAAAQGAAPLPETFDKTIRPILAEYCLKCHSTEKQKGDLDLERFTTFDEVKRHPKIWQNVIEQLANDEMPPKDKPQPSEKQQALLAGWAQDTLDEIARARAGDPGPVVLRRLSNAEYTHTLRDLTGVPSLDPARQFPTDSAAGEGFMNVGQSLVMSPSLVAKYLDAGKEVAGHAVLLPDGIRFSAGTTRRDWTEELLAGIRGFYARYTGTGGGLAVDLQGIKFDTKDGGVLPLEKYLAVLLEVRAMFGAGQGEVAPQASPGAPLPPLLEATLHAQANYLGLSGKYLATLWGALNSPQPSLLLDPIRARWREAGPDGAAGLAKEIYRWQPALWRFNTVGHIGKAGGPKAWMTPVSPLQPRQEIRLKIPVTPGAADVTLYLVASDAGDGAEGDFVVWEQPRLVAPGRPNLLLRDVGQAHRALAARRERAFASAAACLRAAAEAESAQDKPAAAALARKHGVETEALAGWLDYLGIGSGGPVRVEGYFTNVIHNSAGYDFIQGWGSSETPSLVANASDQHVRIPGNMKPHSVAVHPSPKLAAAAGWRSPIAATLRIEAAIQHAHPECGNGVTWSLELRRGATRQRLAAGTAQGSKVVQSPPVENLAVRPGDLISLLIGPRDGNHSCDLTAVDLTLTETGQRGRQWDLAKDVSPSPVAGNPHADRFGNEGIWHFYTEPDKGGTQGPVIPSGSLLARWQSTSDPQEKQILADKVQALLVSGPPADKDSPDAALYRQLATLGGPLLGHAGFQSAPGSPGSNQPETRFSSNTAPAANPHDVDPALFGKHPNGAAIDPASLCVHAPSLLEIRLPAELAEGCELVTTGLLHPETGGEGSVQLQVLTSKPEPGSGLVPSQVRVTDASGPWTSNNRSVSVGAPIVVCDGSAARRRIEAALDEFRSLFPAALCYTKIVPVDEVVTLTLFYREDEPFRRLLLDDAETERLDRLWDELHYVSQDALTLVDAYDQLWQFATQDADPKVFEPLREPIRQRAADYRQRLLDTQPKHLDAILDFAQLASRRPLAPAERDELRALYKKLRERELPHDEAIQLTLARVLVSPAFLYRAEKPGPGTRQGPVNDWELATRLSYFLWASTPDAPLLEAAAQGGLRRPEALAAHARRMLKDPRARLAVEFACAWLHLYDFDTLDEKSERHFPEFAGLRGAMREEAVQFFADLFQNDRSVLEILDSDHTFLNAPLAKFYGVPGLDSEPAESWRRVDGMKAISRGGILGQAATLAKQSGASRTSPILRGNWITEVLLGEKMPRPPKDVPRLPEDETATEGLTVRQLVEKHSADPKCAGCHVRMDPYGYALEGFDAIGRRRDRDLGGRPIDTHAKVMDGAAFEGLDGLRRYLLAQRREAFLKQFCRKLLGYALGRGVMLSDEPLLKEMRARLDAEDCRVGAAIDTIVRSRQFREIRGIEVASDE